MPVSARSPATTIAAATPTGQAFSDPHQASPSNAPMAAPTTGNQPRALELGALAPPSGVRKARALRIEPPLEGIRVGQLHHAPRYDEQGHVGRRGDCSV